MAVSMARARPKGRASGSNPSEKACTGGVGDATCSSAARVCTAGCG